MDYGTDWAGLNRTAELTCSLCSTVTSCAGLNQ